MNDQPEIIVYGADWCPDTRRAKRLLDERRVPYSWVDIDRDHAGDKFVIAANHGNRSIPTIVFKDGSVLVEPSNAELSAKLYATRLE